MWIDFKMFQKRYFSGSTSSKNQGMNFGEREIFFELRRLITLAPRIKYKEMKENYNDIKKK